MFSTTPDGADAATERMRIESSGDITVNFDGSSQTGQFNIADGSESSPGLTFWADGSGDTGIFRSGANTLNFTTGGSERLRIDSSGNVVVGGTSLGAAGSFGMEPNGHVRTVLASGTTGDTLFGAISGVSNGFQINISGTNSQMYRFHNGSTVTAQIDSDGLKFKNDTAAANALDDYEEGTHQTTVTISGNTTFSYSSRNLAYTKIGRVVHLIGRINLTGAGGGSSFEFTLPFTNADGSPDFQFETSNEFQVIRGNDTRTFRIREGESSAKCQADGSPSDIGDSSPHLNVFLTYFTNA